MQEAGRKSVQWDGEPPTPKRARELLAEWRKQGPVKPPYLARLSRETAEPLRWSGRYRLGMLVATVVVLFGMGFLLSPLIELLAIMVWLGWLFGCFAGYYSSQYEILEAGRDAAIQALEEIASRDD